MNFYFVGAPTLAKGLDDFNHLANEFSDDKFYWFCHSVSEVTKAKYSSIHFEVGLNDEKLKSRIKQKMDVFICCSHFEGFCLPIAEAMLLDIPVITYELEEIRAEFGVNITYIKAFDIDAYLRGIRNIVTKEISAKDTAKAKQYVVNNFSPEKVSLRFIEIISAS